MAERDSLIAGATAAGLFGIYADLAYNTYSATNSSPQTTELFAGEREQTLWKYVIIGHLQAVVIGIFGTLLSRKLWPLIGTLSVGAIMHAMYAHAVKQGALQKAPSNSDPGARGQGSGESMQYPGGNVKDRRGPVRFRTGDRILS